jgi:hypothetical protein
LKAWSAWVSEYLSTSYRNEKIDRIFVELLIAQEVYAFGARWRVLDSMLWFLGFKPRALRAMVIVYSELSSSGVVSAKRIHAKTQQLVKRDRQISAANARVTAQERFEGVAEASLQFEPDAGHHGRLRAASGDRHAVAVAAERLEAERIYLSAAEAEPGRDMQAE